MYCSRYNYSPDAPIIVYIPPHTSSKELSKLLSQHKAISYPNIFMLMSKAKALEGKYLKSGEYEIKPHSRPIDIAELLISGEVIQHKITIPEGMSNFQVLQLINAAYGLTGQVDNVPYREGWLMPDTYQYVYPTEKTAILASMHKAMQDFVAKLHPTDTLKNIDEVINLASIVEEEAALPHERSQVAAVYLNRLRKGMLLQADPTVIYGLTDGKYDLGRLLLRKDLTSNSPYNTYIYKGLPPTAISNPGKEAIMAVLSPATNSAIYFVADGKGGHKFSDNYPEHLRNVAEYRKK